MIPNCNFCKAIAIAIEGPTNRITCMLCTIVVSKKMWLVSIGMKCVCEQLASASFSALPVTVLLRDMLPLSLSPSRGSYTESDNVPLRKVCGHARIVLV